MKNEYKEMHSKMFPLLKIETYQYQTSSKLVPSMAYVGTVKCNQ